MAYSLDPYDNSIVIAGFSNGIAPDPYSGIANLQSVNIDSVPNEASVMFATQQQSPTAVSATVTAAQTGTSTNYITVSGAPNLTNGNAISFTGSNIGLSTGTTVYWVSKKSGNNFTVYTDFATTNYADITSNGTAAFFVYAPNFSNNDDYFGNHHSFLMAPAKRFCQSTVNGNSYMVDNWGQVWEYNASGLTTEGWRFTGNTGHIGSDQSNGNGIVYYPASASKGYIFVFSSESIDYFADNVDSPVWVYGWNPVTGSTTSNATLAATNSSTSHDALVGQDNTIYFCDWHYVNSIIPIGGVTTFDPTSTSSYTWSRSNTNGYALQLPVIEQALCLAELNTNLLVGGQRNLIYPWDRLSTSFTYPIWLSESNVQRMVTVKQNTYVFAGNRGRIHITNGSQADVFVKIPDHISGTVSPYFVWGGADYLKNQLIFSAKATDNGGTALSGYGGLWSVTLPDGKMKNLNTFSYGTTNGYANTILALNPILGTNASSNPPGFGFYAGWDSGASTYGIDGTLDTPYTTGVSVIETDLIPLGTFNQPRTGKQLEYKLSKPLVAGESIKIYSRYDFEDAYNSTAIINDSGPTTGFSNSASLDAPANAQWAQFKIVMSSTATSPSYVRLTQIRITEVTSISYPFASMTASA